VFEGAGFLCILFVGEWFGGDERHWVCSENPRRIEEVRYRTDSEMNMNEPLAAVPSRFSDQAQAYTIWLG